MISCNSPARTFSIFLFTLSSLTACGGSSSNSTTSVTNSQSLAALGKQIFEDTALSASGQQSCKTCHDPSAGFSAPEHTAAPLGGINMDLPGFRNTPVLTYAFLVPAFRIEIDGTPVGGMFHDGRVNTLAEQAIKPFTSEFEMANQDAAEVISRLRTRSYFADFTNLFGKEVLNNPEDTLQRMGVALAAFQSETLDFHRFDSKYDSWIKGQASLTQQEKNGLRLFIDPSKGNCAACHPTTPANGVPALFTDFTYDNLGVPRSPLIVANDDAAQLGYAPQNGDGRHSFYDLGICGPFRENPPNDPTLCGGFRVPTLRNVAISPPYFHNGRFATLQETLAFYVRRDTHPEEFYPLISGSNVVEKFNDLPDAYKSNVNQTEAPYNRQPGQAPALSESEINDVVAFLCTLTDGYDAEHPENYAIPTQCTQASTRSGDNSQIH